MTSQCSEEHSKVKCSSVKCEKNWAYRISIVQYKLHRHPYSSNIEIIILRKNPEYKALETRGDT